MGVHASVSKRVQFGHPTTGVAPIKPDLSQFMFDVSELSPAPPPTFLELAPPKPHADDLPPEKNFAYPEAGVYKLKKTLYYQRGYVLTTRFDPKNREKLRVNFLKTMMPTQLIPKIENEQFVSAAHIPGCIKMRPGISFAYEMSGKEDELLTIGAVHTLESLRYETDFWDIYHDIIIVAQGLHGCRPPGIKGAAFPITSFELRPNDRSPTNPSPDSKAGSYNLANTLMKGAGVGTVLPAAQNDTKEFRAQTATVLQALARLQDAIFHKTFSKFEYEILQFNAADMNVVGFGSFESVHATSCQLNLSSMWDILSKVLGQQGMLHTDSHDSITHKTYLLLMLTLPAGKSHGGTFLLAGQGLYVEELDAWVLQLVFDGTKPHGGTEPRTLLTEAEFLEWMNESLKMAWDRGAYVRAAVVCYASGPAYNREASMSMTPAVRFGNFGAERHHLEVNRNFATHGEHILGGQAAWANRVGREAFFSFWNQLQQCDLDLNIDPNELIQHISFKNGDKNVALQPLRYNPVKDAELIKRMRGYFEWYRDLCKAAHIPLTKHELLDHQRRLRKEDSDIDPDLWNPRSRFLSKNARQSEKPLPELAGRIVKVVAYIQDNDQEFYRVLTDGGADEIQVPVDDERIPRNALARFVGDKLKQVSAIAILEPGNNNPSQPDICQPLLPDASQPLLSDASQPPLPLPNNEVSQSPSPSVMDIDPKDTTDTGRPGKHHEITAVLDSAEVDGSTQYLVRWKTTGRTQWVPAEDLSETCQSLLRKLKTAQDSLDKFSTIDWDSEPDTDAGPARKRRKKEKGILLPTPMVLCNASPLQQLLQVDRLKMEVEQVEKARPNKATTKSFLSTIADPHFISTVADICAEQHLAASAFHLVVDAHWSTNEEVARAHFSHLGVHTNALSKLAPAEKATGLLFRMLQWANAKAYIFIYQWCCNIGPQTIEQLLETHRTHGIQGFAENEPLGSLVDHIVQFVCSVRHAAYNRKREKRADTRKISNRAANKSSVAVTLVHGPLGPTVPDKAKLPDDLYGLLPLRPNKKKASLITLSSRLSGHPDDVYGGAAQCLLEVFLKAAILPALRDQHDGDMNSRTRSFDDQDILDRALCRGAVLNSLVQACKDEGILASSGITHVLHSPWLMFQGGRAERLSAALRNRTEVTLGPLQTWLEEHIQNNPSIPALAQTLGNDVHTAIQEMKNKSPHPDRVPPTSFLSSLQIRKKRRPTRSKKVQKPYVQPTIDAILPDGAIPNFALVGIILREALNQQRNLPAGDNRLRRLLVGQYGGTMLNKPARNPDWFDPRRQFNGYTMLFQKHISSVQLTSPVGLSNALSWFGTGQGMVTNAFLSHCGNSGGFFTETVAGMVKHFRDVTALNNNLPPNSAPIAIDNQHAWGKSPNNRLCAQPTIVLYGEEQKKKKEKRNQRHKRGEPEEPPEKYTLEEKFNPYWEQKVLSAWTAHLGAAAGQNPADYGGALPSWSATLDMLADLELDPFKTGLTAMQLVNTLAFSGVVQLPTVMEMADWIANNPSLGAVSGLELLGFRLDTDSCVKGSYICFHNYLDSYLTAADKEILGFHPPGSEHWLCKVSRYNEYLKTEAKVSLVELAAQLNIAEFIPGENETNFNALPIPLRPTREALILALTRSEIVNAAIQPPEEMDMDVDAVGSALEFVQGSSKGGATNLF